MTQPTVSKSWRRVVSHPDRPRSNHANLIVLQYYNMDADIIQENNLTHTKYPKHSEWTQWDEAKSGRRNLWAAQMSEQLQKATQ